MKTLLRIFATILLLYSLSLTKEDTCGTGQISVSGLGKCKSITDLLGNNDLKLKTQNLLYLASNKEGKIEKDGYKLEIYKLDDPKLQSHNMRKSKLYIPNSCFEKMQTKSDLLLDKSKGIVIIVYDSNNRNDNNITDNYFVIRHNSANVQTNYINSKTYDFSFCNGDPILFEDEIKVEHLKYANDGNNPIDVNKILYGRKFGIDLFDPDSTFLSDICVTFTSEKGSDVTLEARLENYFQNISFCDDRENSHYMSYNYSETKNTFTFRCAFGYYKSEEDKFSYVDKIGNQLKSVVSVSNVKVIKCYKEFLNLRDIIRNYGGMICIFVLIIQIVCFLLFCLKGIKPIEDKLDNLFILGKVILRNLGVPINIFGDGFDIKKTLGKKVYLWKLIRNIGEKRKQKEKEEKEKEEKKKSKKKKKKGSNPPEKKGKRKSKKVNETQKEDEEEKGKENKETKLDIRDVEENDFGDDIYNVNIKTKEADKIPKPKGKGKGKKDKANNNDEIKTSQNSKISHIKESEAIPIKPDSNEKINVKPTDNKKEEEKKVENKEGIDKKKQLYEFESDELNELSFEDFIEYDKRSFCRYYVNILFYSHIILSVFFRFGDYNLFTVKLGLFFMTFPINLTMNIFFFTNESITLDYLKSTDDISAFWRHIDNTIYSSLLSSILLILLKLICLTHNSVRKLRQRKNVEEAKKESNCILLCVKIRIAIYYVLSFAFLIIFGFYVLCFCAVFENTQITLIKSTFTSWLISLLYPFIICFITSLVRSGSIKCKSKFLYGVKRIMQFL